MLKIQEENEVYRILSGLTALVETYQREISINMETMAQYDFAFAKAKYSRAMEGNTVKLNTGNYISIFGAKHPLIGPSAVPLDFTIGKDYRAFIITGPNTGGKTVALKTIGLLTMMVQSGLHVPVQEGSEFAVFTDIMADIGDGQSIEQSLSSFSSHIRNIKSIIDYAHSKTLVILDELGAGTDPGEGTGLAVSILETLYDKGATIVATTHFSEIKEFAKNKKGFKNGCMDFDINTLKPLYRLIIGKPGKSNAFLIALRLGIAGNIIERAHEVTYREKKVYGGELFGEHGPVVKEDIKDTEDTKNTKEDKKTLEYHREKLTGPKGREPMFNIGDCVLIKKLGKTGIVYETENSRGEVGVMYKKKKMKINHKKLSLYIEAKELYPEDYDMDIVFESKENRKKRHQMSKKHVKGLVIETKQ